MARKPPATAPAAPSIADQRARLRFAAAASAVCALVVLTDLTVRPALPVALAAVVGSAVLASLKPAQAWAAALMVGLSIPMGHLALHSFDAPDPRPDAPPFSSALALIPAAAGAILGARIRKRSQRPG